MLFAALLLTYTPQIHYGSVVLGKAVVHRVLEPYGQWCVAATTSLYPKFHSLLSCHTPGHMRCVSKEHGR